MANKTGLRAAFPGLPVHFHPIKLLGSGSYGTVASFSLGRNATAVAVKKIRDVLADPLVTRRTLREVKIMRHFGHENIVKLYDVLSMSPGTKDLYMLTELLDYDLDLLFRQLRDANPMCVDLALSLSFQLLNGCQWMHAAGIIHRDLKPSNIFVSKPAGSRPVLKIGDLGLARSVDASKDGAGFTPLTEYVVTRWYRAPEVIMFDESQGYGTPVDTWSVACIMYEMLRLHPLFPGRNAMDQMIKITTTVGLPSATVGAVGSDERAFMRQLSARYFSTKIRPPTEQFETLMRDLPQFTTDKRPACQLTQYMDLLMKMLKFEPNERFNCEDAMRHIVFQDCRKNSKYQDRCKPEVMDFAYDKEFGSNEYPNDIVKQHVMGKLRRALLAETNDRRAQFQLLDNVDSPAPCSPRKHSRSRVASPVAGCRKDSPRRRDVITPMQKTDFNRSECHSPISNSSTRDLTDSPCRRLSYCSSATDSLHTSPRSTLSSISVFAIKESNKSWSAISELGRDASPASTASTRSTVTHFQAPDYSRRSSWDTLPDQMEAISEPTERMNPTEGILKPTARTIPTGGILKPMARTNPTGGILKSTVQTKPAEAHQVASTNWQPVLARATRAPTLTRRSPTKEEHRLSGTKELVTATKPLAPYEQKLRRDQQRASELRFLPSGDLHRVIANPPVLRRELQRVSVDYIRASCDQLKNRSLRGSTHKGVHAKRGKPAKYNPDNRMISERRLPPSIEQFGETAKVPCALR